MRADIYTNLLLGPSFGDRRKPVEFIGSGLMFRRHGTN